MTPYSDNSLRDLQRYNLVTHFVCARCGTNLRLSYDTPKKDAGIDNITGAQKVDNFIAIHPCVKCYGDATKPLALLKEALGSLELPK